MLSSRNAVDPVARGIAADAASRANPLPTTFVIGDLLYASSTVALSRLADVATGSVLVSGGVGVAPAWSTGPSLNRLTLTGNISAAAWTTSGLQFKAGGGTFTDTSSTGTVAEMFVNKVATSTIAASSATTYTSAATWLIEAPTAGTNVTISAGFAIRTLGGIELRDVSNGAQNISLSTSSTGGIVTVRDSAGTAKVQLEARTGAVGQEYVRAPVLRLDDGITAPTATVGFAKIFVDVADGDLKVIFGDGTVKTLATDT